MTPRRPGVWSNRYLRRCAVALVVLAAIDPFVPRVVGQLERARYETAPGWRFENDDLFGMAPVVDYFRGTPAGPKPRAGFVGNSVVYGYGLVTAGEALPGQFQRLVPGYRVTNLSMPGIEDGTAYLVSKAVIDAFDVMFWFHAYGGPSVTLASTLPIDEDDRRLLGLPAPARFQTAANRVAGTWQLFDYAYRAQHAIFGMSTRTFLYLNKSHLPRSLLAIPGSLTAAAVPLSATVPSAAGALAEVPTNALPPSTARLNQLREMYPLDWRFATAAIQHGKKAVLVDYLPNESTERGYARAVARADMNGHFAPNVRFIRLFVPRPLRAGDGLHLSAEGSGAAAAALFDATRDMFGR